MKTLYMESLFILAKMLIKLRIKYFEPIKIYRKICLINSASSHHKSSAYLYSLLCLFEMNITENEQLLDQIFKEISGIVDEKNQNYINNEEFLLAAIISYSLKIALDSNKLDSTEIHVYLQHIEKLYGTTVRIVHSDYFFQYAYINMLNAYDALMLDDNIIEIIEDTSTYSNLVMDEYTQNVSLFFKGKALLRKNEIEKCYAIFKSIKNYFTQQNSSVNNFMAYIYYGLGRYYKEQNHFEKAKNNFSYSRNLLQEIDTDMWYTDSKKKLKAEVELNLNELE